MKTFLACSLIASAAWSAPAIATVYSCEIDPPRSLYESGAEIKLNPIGFPPEIAKSRKFSIELNTPPGEQLAVAKISWEGNPMNIAGEFGAIPTAPGAVVITAFSGGPCLFTEQACSAAIQIVDQKDGKAQLLILPAAISTNKEADTREPFVAVIQGQCSKSKAP